MNKKKKTNLKIETENLAVPEIYVDDEELSEDDDLAESDNGILYESRRSRNYNQADQKVRQ